MLYTNYTFVMRILVKGYLFNFCFPKILKMAVAYTSTKAVENFQKYLRIATVQPNPDYESAVSFLISMSRELDLPYKKIEIFKNKPIFWMTWQGKRPELQSVVLNSHMDVVPVYPEYWTYDPFSAFKDEKGDIYARGSQDMKCVGIQYLEAIRKLKGSGHRFDRTIHILFVPDEEIGGHQGMQEFVKHPEFHALNVGFALDEGLASPTESYMVYYGERCAWWIRVSCKGDPGHGSQFIKNHAGAKLEKIISSLNSFRHQEEERLQSNSDLALGDVTTVNLTMLEGGVQANVVPSELCAYFDIRIPPTVCLPEFEKQLVKWCSEAGSDVTYTYKQQGTCQKVTDITYKNPWWNGFKKVMEERKQPYVPTIFPAATDSRYLREIDIPAIGFSPIKHTPILLHDHNEFLNEQVFLEGIDVYCQLIPELASVEA